MTENLISIFYRRAASLHNRIAVQYKEGHGPYRELSWGDFASMVERLGAGLAAEGLAPGQSAAILAPTAHLWVAADLAIESNGAISVPIYPTSSQADIKYILNHSGCRFVFVGNDALLGKVLAVRDELPDLKRIVLLSAPAGGRSLAELDVDLNTVIGLPELENQGGDFLESNKEVIRERVASLGRESLATIIYTSGTTGQPKGVGLTHGNVISVLEDLSRVIPISHEDVYLSFLPLSHVFERVCGQFYWLHSGGVCAFAEGIEHVGKNMAEINPTMVLVVPRVLDQIYSKVLSGIQGASPRAQKLISWAIDTGRQVMLQEVQGKTIRAGLKAKHWLAEKLVCRKLRNRIGSRLRLLVSGGAAARAEVIEFFNAIGITTLEGYGLTETTAPASVNRVGKIKAGTVGPALPSVEMQINTDGEILIKGPSVFSGYFGQDSNVAGEPAERVFTKGWFHTGDIGTLDEDGYLTITDRKKDLIVNSAGKNIAPQRIEALLKTIPFVTQAIVFGDRQKHLVALLTLDEQAAISIAQEHCWSFESYKELIHSEPLRQLLRQEIGQRCAGLAEHERVRRFDILNQDLSVEAGELTATLKVKRQTVARRYRELIASLYKREDKAELVSSAR